MTRFTVSGRFRIRGGWRPFETALEAPNEAVATERCFANLGSRHGLKRAHIEIEGVGGE